MIISASRRTDVPRFHGDWMVNRVRAGFVDVRNPLFPRRVSRYSLDPAKIDGIVFWTKDPAPFMDKLSAFDAYPYYFQFTVTPYGADLEPGVRAKAAIVDTFKELARRIGPDRVIWRFDPILINERHTPERQVDAFAALARDLRGSTRHVTISFIDDYGFGGRSVFGDIGTCGVSHKQQLQLAEELAAIARENAMAIDTCAELANLDKYGVAHGRCVDAQLLESIGGCKLSRLKSRYGELEKDRAQRAECQCVESIDIGWPSTCAHGCAYCYATADPKGVRASMAQCDPDGPLICGAFDPAEDKLTDHRGTGDSRDRSFRFNAIYNQESLGLF